MREENPQPPRQGEGDDFELPDHRLVNKSERERRKAERRQERSKRRSEGEHKTILAQVCSLHRDDPFRQLGLYLRKTPQPALTGTTREVGHDTRTEFGNTLKLVLNELLALRRPIRNLNEFGRKQALALIRRWVDAGLSGKTIRCRISHLRKFVTLAGRPGEIPDGKRWKEILEEAGIQIPELSQVRKVPKTFTAAGVDPVAKAKEVAQFCEWCALYILLALAFGMRLKECVELNPFESDLGITLHLMFGTKARLPRHVDFSTDPVRRAFQEDVLARAKEMALKNPRRKLRIRGYSIDRMISRAYYIFRKGAITMRDGGIVFHGLRHEYALQDYQERRGLPAPVLAIVPPRIYEQHRESVQQATRGTMKQVGHSREPVFASYGGSVRSFNSDCVGRQREYLAMIQGSVDIAQAVAAQGVDTCWLVGSAAEGLPLGPLEPIGFAVQFGADYVPPDLAARRAALSEALATLGRPFVLSVRLERPPEGLEVIFPSRKP